MIKTILGGLLLLTSSVSFFLFLTGNSWPRNKHQKNKHSSLQINSNWIRSYRHWRKISTQSSLAMTPGAIQSSWECTTTNWIWPKNSKITTWRLCITSTKTSREKPTKTSTLEFTETHIQPSERKSRTLWNLGRNPWEELDLPSVTSAMITTKSGWFNQVRSSTPTLSFTFRVRSSHSILGGMNFQLKRSSQTGCLKSLSANQTTSLHKSHAKNLKKSAMQTSQWQFTSGPKRISWEVDQWWISTELGFSTNFPSPKHHLTCTQWTRNQQS